ncbi:MAG: RND family transporter [Sandaracinaceae bacterium]
MSGPDAGDERRDGAEPPRRGFRARSAAAFDGALAALAERQLRSPLAFVGIAFALGLAALPLILGWGGLTDGLTLNSDFRAMLPEHARSVRDIEEIEARFGGVQALMVTVESEDTDALHRFVRELAPRVEALEERGVEAVDWNISEFVDFVEEHRHLYADLADLRELRDVLEARIDHEREQVWSLGLEDETDPPDPEAVLRRIEGDVDDARGRMDEYPDGFLQHPDKSLVLMVVRTRIDGGEAGQVERLIGAIRAEARALGPDSYADDIELHFGGSLAEVLHETRSLVAAVRNATLITISLVFLAIFVFFRRVRPIPLLGLSLVPPVLITFGFAELTVDYLNASSAFLSSIVVGNGINPNVIWMARYFEGRRQGRPLAEAIRTSNVGTWRGTLTAGLAASLAYASLIITDYRGFRDFGIVGGSGLILCWIGAYTLLPALAVLWERYRPLVFGEGEGRTGVYGVLFGRLALGSPRTVVAVSTAATVGAGALVAWAIVADPLEYDFRKLRSRRDPDGELMYVREASIATINPTQTGSALAVLAPDRQSVELFREQLDAYRAEPGHEHSFGRVRTIDQFLPKDQEAKVPVLAELRELMLEARPYLAEDEQRLIDEQLPPEQVPTVGPEDLPASVARTYTERDGSRGRLLFVEHDRSQNAWDGQYLVSWAQATRSLEDSSGVAPPVAGTAVVFADLNRSVWREGPRTVGVSLLATIVLVILTFRRTRERFLTLGALLVGILWMAGTMAAFDMRLNFLNFVAFPITFGNGVDYAVNVMRRYVEERGRRGEGLGAIQRSVEETGGAVVLCSLTTVIGYTSLYTSTNQALNSFGAAMAISEVTCLAAAVLALPAALLLLARRRDRPSTVVVGDAASGPDARPSSV